MSKALYKITARVKTAVAEIIADGQSPTLAFEADGQPRSEPIAVTASGTASVLRNHLQKPATIYLLADGAVTKSWTFAPDTQPTPVATHFAMAGRPETGSYEVRLMRMEAQNRENQIRHEHEIELLRIEKEIDEAQRELREANRRAKDLEEKLKETAAERDKFKGEVDTDASIDKTIGWAKAFAPLGAMFARDKEMADKLMVFGGVAATDPATPAVASLPAPQNDQERRALQIYEFLKDPQNADMEPGLYDLVLYFIQHPQDLQPNLEALRKFTQNATGSNDQSASGEPA